LWSITRVDESNFAAYSGGDHFSKSEACPDVTDQHDAQQPGSLDGRDRDAVGEVGRGRCREPGETAIDAHASLGSFRALSVQEIQSQLTKLSPEEQAGVARFLDSLRQTHTPEFARELAEGHREMDAGGKISEAELARLLDAYRAAPRP
jgi:hypothetical protein